MDGIRTHVSKFFTVAVCDSRVWYACYLLLLLLLFGDRFKFHCIEFYCSIPFFLSFVIPSDYLCEKFHLVIVVEFIILLLYTLKKKKKKKKMFRNYNHLLIFISMNSKCHWFIIRWQWDNDHRWPSSSVYENTLE